MLVDELGLEVMSKDGDGDGDRDPEDGWRWEREVMMGTSDSDGDDDGGWWTGLSWLLQTIDILGRNR